MTRIYTLQDVFQQLNQDSGIFIDTNPDEPVNQFIQANEVGVLTPSWTFNDWTPYAWQVAGEDGPTGFWLMSDPAASTSVFDSNPYGPKNMGGSFGGTLTFGTAGPIAGLSCLNTTAGYFSASMATYAAGAPFTFECWVNTGGLTAGNQAICWNSGGAGNGLYITSAGVPTFLVNGVSTTGSALSINTWYHIVGSYDGTNGRLYVGGSLAGTTASVTSGGLNATLQVAQTGGGSSLWNGKLFGLALYPIALSATQQSNHHTWGIAANPSDFTYGHGSPAKYGWFTYPNPPQRGSNRWGSAIWNNGGFLWG